MKRLPLGICRHPDGYLVRVQRNGRLHQCFCVSFSESQKALSAFLKTFGAARPRRGVARTVCHSNTGYIGITKTVNRRLGNEYPRFVVSWRESGIARSKGFYFSSMREREEALERALRWRAKMLGRFYVMP